MLRIFMRNQKMLLRSQPSSKRQEKRKNLPWASLSVTSLSSPYSFRAICLTPSASIGPSTCSRNSVFNSESLTGSSETQTTKILQYTSSSWERTKSRLMRQSKNWRKLPKILKHSLMQNNNETGDCES